MLPAKLKAPSSGILRGPKIEWPRHRAFIRRHACVVTLGKIHDDCEGAIECAHIRLGATNNGTGIKPHDAHCVSLCAKHHKESHRIGEESFSRKYGLNLQSIAKEFAMLSPVEEVREYARTKFRD